MLGTIASVVGIGSSLASAFGANQSSKDQGKIASSQLDEEARFNEMIEKMSWESFARENELLDYLLNTNAIYQDRESQHYDYARDWQDRELSLRQFDWDIANQRLAAADGFSRQEYDRLLFESELNRTAARREYRDAMDWLNRSFGIADNERQWDLDRYNREMEILGGERQWAIDDYRANQGLMQGERDWEINRLTNDTMRAQMERQWQIDELRRNQSLVQGERDYDVNRLESDRTRAALERQFQEDSYRQQLEQMQAERQYELARNEDIAMRAGEMSQVLQRTLSGLGQVVDPDYLGQDDYLRHQQSQLGLYNQAADRAVDRISSVNEAQLINAGMDTSTTGNLSRRDVLENQAMPLYEEAVAKATQDALAYITGMNQQENQAYQSRLAGRNQTMSEVSGSLSPELEYLLQIQQGPTAASGAWGNLGTGIVDRNLASALVQGDPRSAILERSMPSAFTDANLPSAIGSFDPGSANDFSAPITPSSRVQNLMSFGLPMHDTIENPVGMSGNAFSSVAPANPNSFWNPLSSVTSAASIIRGPSGDPNAWAQGSAQASGAAGENFSDAINQGVGLWDNLTNPTGFGSTNLSDWPNGGRNFRWLS